MGTDPEPENAFGGIDTKCTMAQANSNRPVRAYSLQMERRMLRIGLEQLIVGTGKLLEFRCEFVEVPPKPTRSVMAQIFFVSPRSSSARASAANLSSLPSATSRSS